MKIKASIIGEDILSSGTIVLNEIQVGFKLEIEDIELNFEFASGDEPKANSTLISPRNARFVLSGFDSPLGTYYELKNVSTINGMSVSVIICVIGNGKIATQHVVHYTITSPKIIS